MRLTVLIITILFVFSVVPGICIGQNRVVVIPLIENEASGDALSGDVLMHRTFSSDEGSGIVGTMPNIGKENIEPGANAQLISEGYHDGEGVVNAVANLNASSILLGRVVGGVTGEGECIAQTRIDYVEQVCGSWCRNLTTQSGDYRDGCERGCQIYSNILETPGENDMTCD